ncbi:hypothetical protein [Corynebacterium epidermidicanis]|uniref:Uncharacterized protein n=1 Tax=Corynebacterium epidermidicanis TaxID=1050174 RepID=A0A0G3GPD8_9CORY|nr:hypothetical protein [Corynebacterium epidermidicanis]AKK02440.1 hypothetical protein CEPID_02800 [Corynebacterium epidermidicanis]
MRDLHFEPDRIVRLSAELSQQTAQLAPISLTACPDNDFGFALSAAVDRCNSYVAAVHSFSNRVANNSLRVLDHAQLNDIQHAQALERLELSNS